MTSRDIATALDLNDRKKWTPFRPISPVQDLRAGRDEVVAEFRQSSTNPAIAGAKLAGTSEFTAAVHGALTQILGPLNPHPPGATPADGLRGVKQALDELREVVEDLRDRPTAKAATIVDLADDAVALVQPIQIVIEEYEDEVTASWPEVGAFGASDSQGGAIMALKQDIISVYQDLSGAPESELGAQLLSQKRALARAISPDAAARL